MNVEEFIAMQKKDSRGNLKYWQSDIEKLIAFSCTYADVVRYLKINGVETTANAVGFFCRRHGITKKKLTVTKPINTCSADQPSRPIEKEKKPDWDHSAASPETHPSPATYLNSPDTDISQTQPKPTSLRPQKQNEGKRRVFLGRAISDGAGSRPKVESEAIKRLREKSKLVPDYPSEMFSRARREREESAGHGSDDN